MNSILGLFHQRVVWFSPGHRASNQNGVNEEETSALFARWATLRSPSGEGKLRRDIGQDAHIVCINITAIPVQVRRVRCPQPHITLVNTSNHLPNESSPCRFRDPQSRP